MLPVTGGSPLRSTEQPWGVRLSGEAILTFLPRHQIVRLIENVRWVVEKCYL